MRKTDSSLDIEPHASVREPAQRLRKDEVLLREHALSERGFVIARQHGNGSLDDDRAVVERGRYEVHRAAVQPHARRERLAMCVQARKCGQQRRMDVHHPSGVTRDEALAQDAHEPGESDPIGRVTIDAFGERRIEVGARRESTVIERLDRNACCPRDVEAGRLRVVAQYGCDVQIGCCTQDRLHVAAASGDQNDDPVHRRQITRQSARSIRVIPRSLVDRLQPERGSRR